MIENLREYASKNGGKVKVFLNDLERATLISIVYESKDDFYSRCDRVSHRENNKSRQTLNRLANEILEELNANLGVN